MTRLPRAIDSGRRLTPSALSLSLTLTPASSATMTLPPDEKIDLRQLVELYTPQGSAGIFRVQALDTTYTGQTEATLQHGVCTLQDALIPGSEEKTGSARELLTLLLAQQDPVMWQLGDVEIPDDKSITWEYDHSNVLDGVLSVIERAGKYFLDFDQKTAPWTLHVRALTDDDACECRLNRNLDSLMVTADTSQLCTRLYVTGLDEPLDADTLPIWGPVVRTMTADEDLGEEMLAQVGRDYLETHKNPMLTVELDALELSQATGESFDRFHLGRMCRVALPQWQTTIRQRVVALNYPDVYATPELVGVTLANEAESAADNIASLIVDTTVQRKLTYKNGQELDMLKVRVITAEESLTLYADQINTISLGLNLLANDVSILGNEISLKASADELQEIANAQDAVELRLSSAENEILLKANRIELQGYVKVDDLQADVIDIISAASVPYLAADEVGAGTVIASVVSTESLQVSGNYGIWRTLGLAITYDSFTYSDQQGGMHGITYVKGVSLTTGASSGVTVLGA